MPRVISSDVRETIWAPHQNELSGQNVSDKLSLDGICALKPRSQKNYPGTDAGEPAPFWKWKISSTVSISGRFPESWTSPPLTTIGRMIKKDLGGGSALQAQDSSPVRQDGGPMAGKMSPGFSSISSTTDGEISRVLKKLGVVCHVWLEDGRVFVSFAEKRAWKAGGKICEEKHPRGIMFVAGISAFGPTTIRFVPPDAKVNDNFSINKVLKPLFRKRHPPSVWKRRQCWHAAPRQRPSAYGRGHCPVAERGFTSVVSSSLTWSGVLCVYFGKYGTLSGQWFFIFNRAFCGSKVLPKFTVICTWKLFSRAWTGHSRTAEECTLMLFSFVIFLTCSMQVTPVWLSIRTDFRPVLGSVQDRDSFTGRGYASVSQAGWFLVVRRPEMTVHILPEFSTEHGRTTDRLWWRDWW